MSRCVGRPIHLLSPGPIDQPTGGYAYLRRMVAGLGRVGEAVTVHELPGPHPFPSEEGRLAADAAIARIPDAAVVVVDGLALPAAAHSLWVDRHRLRLVALVHHPLCLETGLTAEEARLLGQVERMALAQMRRVIAASERTAADLDGLGVPLSKIAIVPPGTDRAPRAEGSPDGTPTLLMLATLTPRKGHLTLLRALDACRDIPWRLTCVGSPDLNPAHAAAVAQAVADSGLADRITLAGAVPQDRLDALWRQTDLFVLPSSHEGYGMAAAEALARGIPCVVSAAGALPEVVPPGAGAIVPPGDVPALAAALRRLLTDGQARAAAAARAATAGAGLPDWTATTDRLRSELARAVPQDERIERIA